MANSYTRRINLFINGKEVKNNINSIQGEMRKLINEQRRMTIGSEEYNQQTKKIGRLKGILNKHQNEIRNLGKGWASIAADKIRKYWGLVASGVASITGLAIAYKRAADAADNFEERLDNLSALTGLQGQDLESLGRTAQDMSVKITEGGVRIKQSADSIVDAFTKVGSQRPELLKNKEALAAVTEDAILLSEAAKSDLEPAVKGLTTTMNQFNLPAGESRRIINAMAAGSKAGAADIPYLTEAIEKSGTTMNLMNVSLEENIGLIEAVAPNYAKASLAGNSLDKVFLKIKEKQIGYIDGTFNLNAALNELATRYAGGETAADLFGVEHAKMGELLVQNRGKVQEYTAAVTGTSVAIEQAAKNTDNSNAITKQAQNAFHNAAVEIGKNLSPAMTALYQVAGSVAQAFTRMIATSPAESLRKEQTEINNLVTSIIAANDNQRVRNSLIQQLNNKYPDFLGNIDSEKVNNQQLRDMLMQVNAQYRERIKLAALQEKSAEVQKEGIELAGREQEIIEKVNRLYQQFRYEGLGPAETFEEQIAAFEKAGERHGFIAKGVITGVRNLGKEYHELQNTIQDNINDYQKWQELADKVEQRIAKPADGEAAQNKNNQTGSIIDSELTGIAAKTIGGALEKLIGEDPEKQKEAIEKYFREAGEGAFDEFMAAIEARSAGLEFPVALTQGEATQSDPELDYSIQKYQESLEFQELLNQTKYENGLIGEQEYQDQLTELNRQGEEERLAVKQENWDKARQLSQFGLNFVTSLMNMELEAAGENEEKKKQIRKKYAMAQFLTTASQIVVDTAAAIIKALAELGPIAGAIAAGIVGATGAVQLATAYGEMQKVKGYASGGYTNGDRIYRAGEEGQEWIAPNRMLTDPFTGPVIQSLEQLRNRRSYVNPLAIAAVQRGNQINYPSRVSHAAQTSVAQPIAVKNDPETTAVLKKLDAKMEIQIKATNKMTNAAEKLWKDGTYTRLLGRDGLINQESEYKKMKSKVTL